jgi:hypothetical protein
VLITPSYLVELVPPAVVAEIGRPRAGRRPLAQTSRLEAIRRDSLKTSVLRRVGAPMNNDKGAGFLTDSACIAGTVHFVRLAQRERGARGAFLHP